MSDTPTSIRYHRLRLALDIAGLALSAAFLAVAVGAGAGPALVRLATRASANHWWQIAFVTTALGIAHAVVTSPLRVVRSFLLPRRFGLLHQSFRGWLGDQLKAAALGGLVALVVIEAIEGLLATTPLWWLFAAAFVIVIALVTTAIFPVWIMPLFYRMTPLADTELRNRLLALATRAGVRAIGVFVVDQSRKSRTANALVSGFGRTRRIVLFDTLVSEFQPDEIESVLAHELGHHVHRDLMRGLLAQAVLSVATFWLADVILRATAGTLGPVAPSDPAGIPWLVAILGALGVIAVPLGNAVSRRMEREADDFALATTQAPGPFVGAMQRLASLNLARIAPSRIEEILLYSHPSIKRRIERALTASA